MRVRGPSAPRETHEATNVLVFDPLRGRRVASFDDYFQLIYGTHWHPDGQRFGQRAYNILYRIKPKLAVSIAGTEYDPFNYDKRMPEFIAHVRGNWSEVDD